MFKEDDDDDDGTLETTRYPVMPSLVALQQMRNRLHLAYLGKKLMKWTALATGKELRRLAIELDGLITSYRDDTATAFMLLARSRYFYPKMNALVLENVKKEASVKIQMKHRGIAGVKVVQLEILENAEDPFPYLGIDKGGMTIWDAKETWYNLLKSVLLILEAKMVFNMVDVAHKNATKRANFITHTVIPRTRATIEYILQELSDIERDEMYRVKLKQALLGGVPRKATEDKAVQTDPEDLGEITLPAAQPSPVEVLPEPVVCCKDSDNVCKETKLSRKLVKLKKQLDVIMEISRHFLDSGLRGMEIAEFVQACEDVQVSLETLCITNIDSLKLLKKRMRELRSYLHDIIILSADKSDKAIITPKVEQFGKSCADIVENITRCSCAESVSGLKPINVIDLEPKAKPKKPSKIKVRISTEFKTIDQFGNIVSCTCLKSVSKDIDQKARDESVEIKVREIPVMEETIAPEFKEVEETRCCAGVVDDVNLCTCSKLPFGDQQFIDTDTIELAKLKESISSKSKEIEYYGRNAFIVDDKIRNAYLKAPARDQYVTTIDIEQMTTADKVTTESIETSKIEVRKESEFKELEEFRSCTGVVDSVNRCTCLKLSATSRDQSVQQDKSVENELKATAEIVEPEIVATPIEPPEIRAKTAPESIEIKMSAPKEIKEQIEKGVNTIIQSQEKLVKEGQVNPKIVTCENGHKLKTITVTCKANDMYDDKLPNLTEIEEIGEHIPMSSNRLEEFKHHIQNVIEMTKYYQSDGLLDRSVDEFMKSCNNVLSKIEEYKLLAMHKQKLESLKEQVANLEKITGAVRDEELVSPSIESFLRCCKKFKELLRDDERSVNEPIGSGRLVAQLNEAIELSKEAKRGGLLGVSVDDFIRDCEGIKLKLEDDEDNININKSSDRRIDTSLDNTREYDADGTKVLDELTYSIDDIMKIISNYKEDGLVSESVEEFFKNCQMTKAKIDFYKKYPLSTEELQFEEKLCSPSFICPFSDKGLMACEKCKETLLQGLKDDDEGSVIPPCYTCRGLEDPAKMKICKPCYDELEIPFFFDSSCDTCKTELATKIRRKQRRQLKYDDSSQENKNDVRNLQENKQKKAITKQKQNRHESFWTDDDDDDYDESDSIGSVLTDTYIGMCQVLQAQGFMRIVKSEDGAKPIPLAGPGLRECISADTILSRATETEIVDVNCDGHSYCVVSTSKSDCSLKMKTKYQ